MDTVAWRRGVENHSPLPCWGAGYGEGLVGQPTSRERNLGRKPSRPDEGVGRSDSPDDGRLAVEGRVPDLHLRFHRGPRPHPADHLAPHGKAQRSGPGRVREARNLDLLPAPRQTADRNTRVAKPPYRLGIRRYCYRVRASGAALGLILMVVGCGGSTPTRAHTPSPPPAATPSPSTTAPRSTTSPGA